MSEAKLSAIGAARAGRRDVAGEPQSDRVGTNDFEAVVRELRPDLYRFAFWLTREHGPAEDAVQEALIRAWRSWDRLRHRDAAKSWLLTIVRRECARVHERKRLETRDIDALTRAEQQAIATVEDTDLADMRNAMLALELEYREPLVLQVLMGYSAEEIGRVMDLKPGAVLTRLFRARRKLAEQFDQSRRKGNGAAGARDATPPGE